MVLFLSGSHFPFGIRNKPTRAHIPPCGMLSGAGFDPGLGEWREEFCICLSALPGVRVCVCVCVCVLIKVHSGDRNHTSYLKRGNLI